MAVDSKKSLDSLEKNLGNKKKAEAADTRDGITKVVKQALPNAAASANGIATPLTEKSRVNTVFEDFDDFNVWSVKVDVATEILMEDDEGTELLFIYVDPNIPVVPVP